MHQNRKYIPFAKPDIDSEDIKLVVRAMESGWLSKGPKVIEFEEKLKATLCLENNVVACNSGTAALHLALLGLGIGNGDEVIVPSFTFCSTVNVIEHVEATPIFVDIVEDTLCMDIEEVKKKINKKTKAVIMVHFGGRTHDLSKLSDLCRENEIYLIEDAAHALGTKYKNKYIGNHGDIICYSFYATKNITTGEGGALSIRNSEIEEKIRLLSWHGITKSAWNRYDAKGTWKYDVVLPGFKYNMSDIQAGLGLNQLFKMEEMRKKREKIAQIYTENLLCASELLVLPENKIDDQQHSWHLYPIRIKESNLVTRDELIEELKNRMVGTSVHFIPVHMHPYYKTKYDVSLPITEKVYVSIVSLPIYSQLATEDVYIICSEIIDIIKNHGGRL